MGLFMSKEEKRVLEWAKGSTLFRHVDYKHSTSTIYAASSSYSDVSYHFLPSSGKIELVVQWQEQYGSYEDAMNFCDQVENSCAHAVKSASLETMFKFVNFLYFDLVGGGSGDFIDTIQTRVKEFERDFVQFVE